MKKLNLLLVAVGCVFLGGCASVPMTSTSLDGEAKRFSPETGKASVYVNRGGGIGTAVTVQTVLDGRIVGSLAPNTYQLLSVSPGERVLSTGAGAENVEQIRFNAEAGRNYFFRVSLAMGWALPRIHLRQIDDEEGRKAVHKSKRAESATY